jgi:hypothetical protein
MLRDVILLCCAVTLSAEMLIVMLSAEICYAQCSYTECHYAECRYPKCRGALKKHQNRVKLANHNYI